MRRRMIRVGMLATLFVAFATSASSSGVASAGVAQRPSSAPYVSAAQTGPGYHPITPFRLGGAGLWTNQPPRMTLDSSFRWPNGSDCSHRRSKPRSST